jgi:hypothetical protein
MSLILLLFIDVNAPESYHVRNIFRGGGGGGEPTHATVNVDLLVSQMLDGWVGGWVCWLGG